MPKYAVFFTKSYALEVEAESSEHAADIAFDSFSESEADAASIWELETYIDKLED